MTVFRITDNNSGQWWCQLLNCSFLVISIRQHTVIVKAHADEGYEPPYNVHEFPKTADEFINSRNIIYMNPERLISKSLTLSKS